MLIAENLTFGYDESAPLLRSWSHEFRAGEIVAITGPSGRGKSTLLYLLGLMLAPRSGQIWLDGIPASARGDRERAHLRATRYGFVFQDAVLDATRSVLDNVVEGSLYRDQSREVAVAAAQALLDKFGVALRARARPGQVSGGQAQRIALCRALLANPAIVLADEPTGNLDGASADLVLGALIEHARSGAAVAVVTHDRSIADRCDREISV